MMVIDPDDVDLEIVDQSFCHAGLLRYVCRQYSASAGSAAATSSTTIVTWGWSWRADARTMAVQDPGLELGSSNPMAVASETEDLHVDAGIGDGPVVGERCGSEAEGRSVRAVQDSSPVDPGDRSIPA